eukprot:11177929-Alexandrium_andersonii.AAC.1
MPSEVEEALSQLFDCPLPPITAEGVSRRLQQQDVFEPLPCICCTADEQVPAVPNVYTDASVDPPARPERAVGGVGLIFPEDGQPRARPPD